MDDGASRMPVSSAGPAAAAAAAALDARPREEAPAAPAAEEEKEECESCPQRCRVWRPAEVEAAAGGGGRSPLVPEIWSPEKSMMRIMRY